MMNVLYILLPLTVLMQQLYFLKTHGFNIRFLRKISKKTEYLLKNICAFLSLSRKSLDMETKR